MNPLDEAKRLSEAGGSMHIAEKFNVTEPIQ
jgi:hypothetical protein